MMTLNKYLYLYKQIVGREVDRWIDKSLNSLVSLSFKDILFI